MKAKVFRVPLNKGKQETDSLRRSMRKGRRSAKKKEEKGSISNPNFLVSIISIEDDKLMMELRKIEIL